MGFSMTQSVNKLCDVFGQDLFQTNKINWAAYGRKTNDLTPIKHISHHYISLGFFAADGLIRFFFFPGIIILAPAFASIGLRICLN